VTADIYRYEIDADVAVFDLTEFDVAGGLLLQECFETLETVLARPDVTGLVLVFGADGGLSTWFFERFDDLFARVGASELDRVAVVASSVKQAALRGRLRPFDVSVETPETPGEALQWARTQV
jgi:hypothetical protein